MSNGYGTLMEAGLGPVEDLGTAFQAAQKGPLALATFNGMVCLFFTNPGSEQVEMRVAQYGSV